MYTRRQHAWDRFSWTLLENDNEGSEETDGVQLARRQYKMRERIRIDTWDDQDFFMRFRLQKSTVAMVLEIIRPHLDVDENR